MPNISEFQVFGKSAQPWVVTYLTTSFLPPFFLNFIPSPGLGCWSSVVCYIRPVSKYVENEKENNLENCVLSQQSHVCNPIVLQIKISYLECQHLNINFPSMYILALTILMPSKVHECLRDFMHGYAKEKSVLMYFKMFRYVYLFCFMNTTTLMYPVSRKNITWLLPGFGGTAFIRSFTAQPWTISLSITSSN